MIIRSEDDVTAAVLAEMHRTPDPRTKELLTLFVKHLHAFVREARLTEGEFQDAIALVNAVGKRTTPSHNEAMLLAGALGVSNLVCLLNNGALGTRPTQANNLGPFYRAGSPRCAEGESIVRSPTPGAPLYSAARAGATMLAKNVAAEVASTGVQVNVLGTNFMDFPEFLRASRAEDPEGRARVEAQVTQQLVERPHHVLVASGPRRRAVAVTQRAPEQPL